MTYKLPIATLWLLTFLLPWPVAALLGQQPASQTDSSSRATGNSGSNQPAGAAGKPVSHPAPEEMPAVDSTASSRPAPARTVVASSSETIGSLTGGNLYSNPALGISLQFTGEWEFMDAETQRLAEGRPAEDDAAAKESAAKRRAQCTGPVCGDPVIDVALFTELNPTIGASSLFIAGFRLAPSYLDRKQYPLKWFSEIMLPHSAADAGLQPASDPAEIQLGGRPAYRLLVHRPGEEQSKEVGYVVETNGYMVLVVGSTADAADLPKLRQQIESIKFGKPAVGN